MRARGRRHSEKALTSHPPFPQAALTMADGSTLRAVFDRVERLVGRPLERAVLTETFMNVFAGAVHVQATVRQASDVVTSTVLHQFNLPAHSDVVSLAADVRRLEASIRDLADHLDSPSPPRNRARAPRRARG